MDIVKKLNNKVIELLDKDHGRLVKDFFTECEIDTLGYEFKCYAGSEYHSTRYYGLSDGDFDNAKIEEVERRGLEIITLEEAKEIVKEKQLTIEDRKQELKNTLSILTLEYFNKHSGCNNSVQRMALRNIRLLASVINSLGHTRVSYLPDGGVLATESPRELFLIRKIDSLEKELKVSNDLLSAIPKCQTDGKDTLDVLDKLIAEYLRR